MISLLKKTVPVEVIHTEFDSAQDRILDECSKVLAELKIPTETQIERKAAMLEELGFVNSETVHQAKSLKQRAKEIETQLNLTRSQVKSIYYFKQKYPFEKFITVDELERICEKYNLIHAPARNYIRDIPEKNVLEMKKCKKLDDSDKCELIMNFPDISKVFLKAIGKKDTIFTYSEVLVLAKKYWDNPLSIMKWFENASSTWSFAILKGMRGGISPGTDEYDFTQVEKIDRAGIFIAAPKSHFNLNGLSKKSKFGFFNVTVHEVKDPVVFEYCKDNLCRIITKWGTDDDQSYLDPALINELLN